MAQKIGLVLGAGVARGWSHIGALRRLESLGIKPDIVCGCSVGALVGASYVTGHLDALQKLVRSLTRTRVLRYMDFSISGAGLIEGRWVMKFFEDNIDDTSIEAAGIKFATVATELSTGREAWLTTGSIIDAVRASIAVPGLITPLMINDRWLVDGALVNPLPVSLCRALGADVIIGVSLNGDLIGAPPTTTRLTETATKPVAPQSTWLRFWASGASSNDQPVIPAPSSSDRPGYIDIIGDSFFLVQAFISRVRLAADPVDLLITPDISHIGLMDFHRGEECIAAGEAAVDAVKPRIEALGLAKHFDNATPEDASQGTGSVIA